MTSRPTVFAGSPLRAFSQRVEVTFGHVDHVTDQVADFPFGAAGLHVPVLGIVDQA